jgi:hypothetical protein
LLTKQLGITESQADGGVGSILQLAKEKLTSGQFDTIAKTIPDSQKYLDAAKRVLTEGKVGNANGLQSAFSELGMGQDTLAKFKAVVTDYVGQVGGPQAKNLLESALK